MLVFEAAVLGVVQGLTEFLPISSSGHLVLVSKWLGWEDLGVAFAIAVHLGTLLAVIIYFWRDWVEILSGKRKGLLWSLLTATLVTAVIGLLVSPYRDGLNITSLIAIMLLIFGILLWVVDVRAGQRPARAVNQQAVHGKAPGHAPNLTQSLWLGLVQAIALVPGVSRSGIVITAARGLKLNREQAARYAFLLSAPIIALTPLALIFDLTDSSMALDTVFWTGFLTSALAGWLAIALFLALIKRISFGWFALYRTVIAALIFLF